MPEHRRRRVYMRDSDRGVGWRERLGGVERGTSCVKGFLFRIDIGLQPSNLYT
jgi:hypothetical protein